MSKWHKATYELTAAILSCIEPNDIRDPVTIKFAQSFQDDNERFDSARFFEAVNDPKGELLKSKKCIYAHDHEAEPHLCETHN